MHVRQNSDSRYILIIQQLFVR